MSCDLSMGTKPKSVSGYPTSFLLYTLSIIIAEL